jgi:hypothetical protein
VENATMSVKKKVPGVIVLVIVILLGVMDVEVRDVIVIAVEDVEGVVYVWLDNYSRSTDFGA